MRKLIRYEHNKTIAIYDDGTRSHRHKLSSVESGIMLGAKYAYSLIKDERCTTCGKRIL